MFFLEFNIKEQRVLRLLNANEIIRIVKCAGEITRLEDNSPTTWDIMISTQRTEHKYPFETEQEALHFYFGLQEALRGYTYESEKFVITPIKIKV